MTHNINMAINGGIPHRKNKLQYGKPTIDDVDILHVVDVLQQNLSLTTGPKVDEFEQAVKDKINVKYALAVNSGTAALHLAMMALKLKPTDEVIVTTMSFVASANVIMYCNAKPVFCDILNDTMNIDPKQIEKLITPHTKAIITVDFAGQPCDYQIILPLAKKHNLVVIEDSAHSFGCKMSQMRSNPYIGAVADITTFSFHPIKPITTGEGGMVVTNNKTYYENMKINRAHGISIDYKQREINKTYQYDMVSLGFNYRIPDILCALGISQLTKVDTFMKKRRKITQIYNEAFSPLLKYFKPLNQKYDSACHIYIIKLQLQNLSVDRCQIFKALQAEGLEVNVKYKPIHLQSFYQKQINKTSCVLPVAEKIYKQIINLPLFPSMTTQDIKDVIDIVKKVITYYSI